jgi:uncharacterized protein
VATARKETRWLETTGPDGEEVRVPVATVYGASDGPTFTVIAGVHASEYVGLEAVKRVFQTVDENELRGRLITVPCLCVPAFFGLGMHVNPIDGVNPGRAFPGDPEGSHTQRIVNLAWEELVIGAQADYVMDVHGGDLEEELVEYSQVNLTGNEAVDKEAERLALALDMPYFVRRPKPEQLPTENTGLHPLAATHGIPAVLGECGSHGDLDESRVAIHYKGITNALKHLDMLPGTPHIDNPHPMLLHRFTGISAPVDGFWYPWVKKGDVIRKGQTVGEMRDFFHQPQALITSDEDALILGVITVPARREGDLLMGLGTLD